MVQIHGTYQQRFEGVRDVFAEHFNQGADTGASFAVFIDGKPVIDLWGGYTDRDFTRPWQRNTIVNTFSTTKTMTALTALLLSDRGVLDLDAPVAKYWPEFAANGKQDVLVRHVVSHTSGLPTWDVQLTLTDMYDWEKSTALLAAQAPLHKPGSMWAYHGLTMGHLVGEVVRRATGLTLGTVFQQELAGPLGVNYHISTWAQSDLDIAPIIQGAPRGRPTGTEDKYERGLYNPWYSVEDVNSIEWRRAELGGANGHGNAYAIAAIQSVLANGGVSLGKKIMSEDGCLRVREVQADNVCPSMHIPVTMGVGYGLASPVLEPDLTTNRVAFWGGNGGSVIHVDFDERMSVGFAQNRWVEARCENIRRYALLKAVYAALH
jgi:CubicO group peptidase (beta-lactamase class C family)